ncbi:glucanase b [Grosmannia clavigera kw1407]|uniref:Glucanase b n=1 Tax=Grosmannia clavigera (strain kw1407 / UAMH 11150) TaxID=655863 RepID=F0XLA4_GROCL|nr:glucanase b [Grosmannia clavigera kw1407]EFX01336.1 glucanase b [Grosmannia clavigera kw1407]
MPDSLVIHLQNHTDSNEVFAYITGLAIQANGARVLLKANGCDLYFPQNPTDSSAILQPLTEDCAIPLGAPGNTVRVTIPQIAGGRIWFSRGPRRLIFLLNPGGPTGPALVEPSVLNPTDPNAAVDFAFAEFTLNSDQLFANISYVDFVSRLPIALTLQRAGDMQAVQHVSGMPTNGLNTVCDGLRAQASRDGRPWDKLIVTDPADASGGTPLRALSPTHGDAVGASFTGYFEPYVEQVWAKYSSGRSTASINTQAAPGIVRGAVRGDALFYFGNEGFVKPTTADILGCNTGPFTTGSSATRNAIIPRLAAALQRSTLLEVADQPSEPSTFYKVDPTNHYCRIVHAANLDGKGYAFAYDDVQPDGGADQSGKANAGDPAYFLVAVGGGAAYAGDRLP